MSDKLLNKINIINKQHGITFSQKEKQKENRELISELDKRITDLLHKIEFTNLDDRSCKKMCMKLQSFLKKKRALKQSGIIYTPRTETGNYIINGKIAGKGKVKNENR
jgi:tRNA C32,U32 (ribose-2'-O)-methylase TrmJ